MTNDIHSRPSNGKSPQNPHFDAEWKVLLDSLYSPVREEGIVGTEDHEMLEDMQLHLRENLDGLSQAYEGQLVSLANQSDLIFSSSSRAEIFDQMHQVGAETPYLLVYIPSRTHPFSTTVQWQ